MSAQRGIFIGECGHPVPVDAPGLTDAELRDRLAALADRARNGSTSPTDSRPAAG